MRDRISLLNEDPTPWEAAVATHVPDLKMPCDPKGRNRLHRRVEPVLLQDPEFRARHEPFRTKIALAGEHPSCGRVLKAWALLVWTCGLLRLEGLATPRRQGRLDLSADGHHHPQRHEALRLFERLQGGQALLVFPEATPAFRLGLALRAGAQLLPGEAGVIACLGGAEDTTVVVEQGEVFESLLRRKEERIHILTVEDSALVNVLQRHAAAVLQKSLREGFGLTATEAMWKRVAVIAGRCGGLTRQIDNGVNGFLVEAVEEATERLVQLLNNPKLRQTLGAKAREMVRERFLLTHMLEQYLDLFSAFEPQFTVDHNRLSALNHSSLVAPNSSGLG